MSPGGDGPVVPAVEGDIESQLKVVFGDSKPSPIRPLLEELKRQMTVGDLSDSELAPDILEVLRDEQHVRLRPNYDHNELVAAIRLADEEFTRISLGAGVQDWQFDFATIATPLIVGATWCLQRSADSLAIVVRLCEVVCSRLRLELMWPETSHEADNLKNLIYVACFSASVLRCDEVLNLLKELKVRGPQ